MEAMKTEIAMGDYIKGDIERVREEWKTIIARSKESEAADREHSKKKK